MHVRRTDVADIFLGTGLGGRAYAIIEQGMISRIVEARPEELRTFLEEAAGISKYRERRSETELRLEDTRENLARVDDIVQELAKQLAHLEAQAEVATRYRELEANLKLTQHLLWLLRKQDAAGQPRALCSASWSKWRSSWKPRPRACASWRAGQETLRVAHYAASDTRARGARRAVRGQRRDRAAGAVAPASARQPAAGGKSDCRGVRRSAGRNRPAATRCRPSLAEQRSALEQAAEQLDECREQERQEAQQLPAAEQAFATHAQRGRAAAARIWPAIAQESRSS